jgi:ABC-type polysaccharide/polyol phosphate export permease
MKRSLDHIESIFSLSLSLAKANFKLRNEGSYLGLFWYLLNPFALFFVILFVRHQAFENTSFVLFPVYLLIGLLMYNFFTQTITAAIGIITANANFIKSLKMPVESIVVSRVMQSIFSHTFEILLIIACMMYFSIPLSSLGVYVIIFILFALFTLGAAFIFATIGVFIPDLSNIWTVLSQILFFMTPIFHVPDPSSLLATINYLNPLYYFLLAGRMMFVEGAFPHALLMLQISSMSIVFLVVGFIVFETQKSKFAELV